MMQKYKRMCLTFPFRETTLLIPQKGTSKLELSERAVFFFLLNMEAVVGEGNPQNRPFPH